VTIRVSDRRLLVPLMDALRSVGCLVAVVEQDRCRVAADTGEDRQQALLELRFFARAWALGHGAEVQVEA